VIRPSTWLKPKQVEAVHYFGRDLVIYRTESGQACLVDPICPHLGANLAGGRVRGNRVECPFHRWQLGGDGRIACVPDGSPPARRRQETLPIRELHGQVFVYHSGAGGPARCDDEPPYEIPRIPEVDEGSFVHRGHHDAGRIRMHLIEFAENSVDFAHFAPIHGRMFVPWTSIPVPGVEIEHAAEWKIDPDRAHLAYFLNRAVLRIFGRKIERTGANAVITFVGPGGVVAFRFTIPDVGQIAMFQTHLPISPLEQQVDFRWFADRKIPRLLVSYVIGNWISQWRNDIEIWENKIYLPLPTLSKRDGPVHRMRRWYRQFYPEPSPRAASAEG